MLLLNFLIKCYIQFYKKELSSIFFLQQILILHLIRILYILFHIIYLINNQNQKLDFNVHHINIDSTCNNNNFLYLFIVKDYFLKFIN